MNTLKLGPPRKVRRICCIGAGYVGGPTCAVIASQIPDVVCRVVDMDAARIDAWNSSKIPVYEPGLANIVDKCRAGIFAERDNTANLFFSTEIDEAIKWADLIFVSVNTPTKLKGEGAGRALDLAYVEAATRRIAQVSDSDKIVVEKSTVPCRTAESIRDVLSQNSKPGVEFDVLSNPEFLAEGSAIQDLLHPDRILIGSKLDARGKQAAAALAEIYMHWVPEDRIITMKTWSSELAKLAANAMLAQRISSMNTLSAICEVTGAEIQQVSYAVGLDSRIGPKMLKSSVGFGGSCFKKDVLALVYLAESFRLVEVAAYWRSVIDINEWQKERFAKRIISSLYNTLVNKKIAILGFAYKGNTGDARESAAISMVHRLVAERARVHIYDPHVTEEHIWQELRMSAPEHGEIEEEYVTVCESAYAACDGAHAAVILTDWDQFRVDSGAVLLNGEAGDDAPKDLSTTPTKTAIVVNGHSHNHNYNHNHDGIHNQDYAHTNSDGHVDINANVSTNSNQMSSPTRPALKHRHESYQPTSDPSSTTTTIPPTAIVTAGALQNSKAEHRLDWQHISTIMMKPMFVFDGRNVVDVPRLEALGFRVECIGSTNRSTMYGSAFY